VLAFAPLALVPLVAAFYLVYLWASAEIEQRELRELDRRLDTEARAVATQLERARGDLLLLAKLASVRNYFQNRQYNLLPEAEIDRKDFEDFARDVVARTPAYGRIRMVDAGGSTISEVVSPEWKGRLPEHPAKEGKGVEADGVRRHVCGADDRRILTYDVGVGATPERRDGWLAIDVDFARVTVGLTQLVTDRVRLVMADAADGSVLYDAGRQDAAQGDEARTLAHRLAGGSFTVAATLAPGVTGDGLWSLRVKLTAILLVAAVLLSAVTLYTAQRFSQPIQALAKGAEAIGNESFDTRVPIPDSTEEIESLARAFNGMAEKLERLNVDNHTYIESLTTMQSQLVQAEKMSAMGRLAAGVAHEVNNPLQGLQNNLYLVQTMLARQGEVDAAVAKRLAQMRDGLMQAQRIVRGLLDYSRDPGAATPRHAVQVDELARQAAHTLEHRLAQYRFELELGATGTVMANPDELCQVLVNLLANAMDATPVGGRVGVTTRDARFSERERLLRGVTARRAEDPDNMDFTMARRRAGADADGDAAIEIEVWDSGPGIARDNQAKIFDPFFTTKELGKGTGLGLSISMGIVKQHRGLILLASQPDQPARLVIKLPANEAAGGREAAVGA
jgi:signal transduction histidine kinase